MSLTWSWQRFAALGADGVYDMLALRAKVFVLEQGAFLDPVCAQCGKTLPGPGQ